MNCSSLTQTRAIQNIEINTIDDAIKSLTRIIVTLDRIASHNSSSISRNLQRMKICKVKAKKIFLIAQEKYDLIDYFWDFVAEENSKITQVNKLFHDITTYEKPSLSHFPSEILQTIGCLLSTSDLARLTS